MTNIHGISISANRNGTFTVMMDRTALETFTTQAQAIRYAIAQIEQHENRN